MPDTSNLFGSFGIPNPARQAATWQGLPQPSRPRSEMRAYDPSWRERIAWAIAQAMSDDKYKQQYVADKVGGAVDFIPGVGEALGIDDTARSIQSGDWLGAGVNATSLAMGLIPAAGDMAGKAVKRASIPSLLGSPDSVFVRWSRGPSFDMKPGAASRDYVSGTVHDGLSAVSLGDAEDVEDILRSVNDYSFLRMKDPEIRPHVYRAKKIGIDSDGAPTISPTEYLGAIDDGLIAEIENNNLIRRLALEREISNNISAIEQYRVAKPKYIPPYSELTLEKARKELDELGGPVDRAKFGLK